MSIPAVKGYMPLHVTPRSHVCDEQGFGEWPMWQRYDRIKNIVSQYIDEQYQDFLSYPHQEVDVLKSEEFFYWFTPYQNIKYIPLSQTGGDYGYYKQVFDETLSHYRSVVDRLKAAGNDDYRFIELSLKHVGETEESIYCGDGRVVVVVWGMRPRPGCDIGKSILVEPFSPTELHTVKYDLCGRGTTEDETILKKSHGTRISAHQIPQVKAAEGYEFIGWDREPADAEVNSDLLFTAQYKTVKHHVRFLMPDGQIIKELEVEHGEKILPGLIPQLPAIDGAYSPAWENGDPYNDTINADCDYQAICPLVSDPPVHIVRFLMPDGQIIKELGVKHGEKILPGLIPQLPAINGVPCPAWEGGDPYNDTINADCDYQAISPVVSDLPVPIVRFLTPDGGILSQLQVEHGTQLTRAQIPPLPVVDGETCRSWDRNPLATKIDDDEDFIAQPPKKRCRGLWGALLKWLLLALGLLLLFLLLWCFIFNRCHFDFCGCDCDRDRDSQGDQQENPDNGPPPVPHTGDVQILLSWSNYNDLDIACIDPSGDKVWYSNKTVASGGQLDIDMNADGPSRQDPIENIYWPTGGAPQGQYKVILTYYARHDSRQIATPYSVTVKHGSETQTYTGTMTAVHQKVVICTFTIE